MILQITRNAKVNRLVRNISLGKGYVYRKAAHFPLGYLKGLLSEEVVLGYNIKPIPKRSISLKVPIMMSGEASLASNGLWYYVLNRSGCQSTLREVFCDNSIEFDSKHRFLSSDELRFYQIYYK